MLHMPQLMRQHARQLFLVDLVEQTVAAALAAQGIMIGRAQPPLDNWVRISIGLPEENAIARKAVAELL